MQDKIEKPVVYFTGEPYYQMWDTKNEVAIVELVLNHPRLGDCRDVRTSTVKYKFDDGSFETRNTIYKPATKEMLDDYNARIEERRKEMQKQQDAMWHMMQMRKSPGVIVNIKIER